MSIERYEPTPGASRWSPGIAGTDPGAPSLCLMGHTDVVPVTPRVEARPVRRRARHRDGRGLGTRRRRHAQPHRLDGGRLPRPGRPRLPARGDLVFFAVADEEAGSAHGARWVADHHPDAIRFDYVLTENGGLHAGTPDAPASPSTSPRRAWRGGGCGCRGTPGHGSMPFRIDNALVKAAAVVQRLAEYRPAPRFHELWPARVETLPVPDEMKAALLDPQRIDDLLEAMPSAAAAAHLHACTHTTFSPNLIDGA